jgi:hypothetical protein
VENRGLEATGLLKEAAALGYGITSLDASIEDLFGLKHQANRADLVHCLVMKMLTGTLNFVAGLKKLDGILKGLQR